MRPNPHIAAPLFNGFRAIRAANQVSEGDAGDEGVRTLAAAVVVDPSVKRRDATDLPMVTLDPASSTDLDQAFSLSREDDLIVLHYAIADIGAFVVRGGAIEAEAWKRGVTVYAPDGSVPLYPRVLSSDKASLLPDGPRPAVLLTVVIDPEGPARLRMAERAWVRSRAKLAYENVRSAELPADMPELAARILKAEKARGAFRLDRPEQQVIDDPLAPGGLKLRFAPRLESEDLNASLSLAANLAVATHLHEHGLGLFRVMDEPDAREIQALRKLAKSLGVPWGDNEGLPRLVERLDVTLGRDVAFSMAIRRAGGGARYLQYPVPMQTDDEKKRNAPQAARPWHAAIAATYAHATAPMRRLADRYVLDLLVAQFAGDAAAIEDIRPLLSQLPALMEVAERRASKVDRECIELVESHMLLPLVGSVLEATVIEVSHDGWEVEIDEPAVVWRVRVKPGMLAVYGDKVKVRVVAAATEEEASTRARSPSRARAVRLVELEIAG